MLWEVDPELWVPPLWEASLDLSPLLNNANLFVSVLLLCFTSVSISFVIRFSLLDPPLECELLQGRLLNLFNLDSPVV